MGSFFKALILTFIVVLALSKPLDITIEDIKHGFKIIIAILQTK